MMDQLTNLNWISILIAFVAYSMLGALWFMALFAKAYKVSLGRANETLQNKAPIYIVGPSICVLVITLVSAVLMNALQIQTVGAGLEFALLVGIGYLVANTVNIAINPNIPRPILYGAISGAYHLVGISIVCCILAGMK